MIRPIIPFKFNKPQAIAYTVMANEIWITASRGSGKTAGIIAPWILHKVENMPRSNGGFLAKSFSDLENKILPPLFLAFEMLGYLQDVHYVYGKKPPENWEKPLTPIVDFTHVLTFNNGTTLEMISLHVKGSANGKSLQWLVADEAKFLNENQLREEVFPILRGHVRYFGASPWYGAKLFVTDKMSATLHWILAKRKLHNPKRVNAVIYYQNEMNQLRFLLSNSTIVEAARIKRQMKKLDVVLASLRKDLVYYGEATAQDNIENLSKDYIDNMRRSLTDYEFRISIGNEDPTRVEDGFYSCRTENHLYDTDFDEDYTQPLGVTLDYQASLAPLVAFQVNDLVIPGVKSLNILDSIYVKPPEHLREVVNKFCDQRKHRPCKEVYYFYDHTAKSADPARKSLYEECTSYFEDNGWEVTQIFMGQAPGHNYKYSKLKEFFEELGDMPIRFHKYRCASLLLAMDQTGTLETDKGTKKDKSKERIKTFPQEQATHLPDAFDMCVWGTLELDLYPNERYIGEGMILR